MSPWGWAGTGNWALQTFQVQTLALLFLSCVILG